MRLLELAALSVFASLLFAASAAANLPVIPAQAEFGPMVTTAPAFERPVPVALPERTEVLAPAMQKPATRRAVVQAPPAPAVRKVQVRAQRATITAPGPASQPAPAPRPTAVADAYPYRTSQTTAPDAWGFTQRQCVSYVAWRLAETGRTITTDQGWASASNWDEIAQSQGVAVTGRPAVGAVAHWNAGESSSAWAGSSTGSFTAGGYGHVAYVTQVFADGSVQVAQYNATGNRAFSTMRLTAPRFLHIR